MFHNRSFLMVLPFAATLLAAQAATAQSIVPTRTDPGASIYASACRACHYRGANKSDFGTRSPISATQADELINVILFGRATDEEEPGMPGYAAALGDADVERLATWLRESIKPDAPWSGLAASVSQQRATGQRED